MRSPPSDSPRGGIADLWLAILHTIFFHRYFTSISPLTRDLLDLTLPAIDDVDLETLIEQRTIALVRAIEGKEAEVSS
jgi:autophagy-related protein 101